MEGRLVDLKLNRSLVDPHFDGYKLSLDSLPIYRLQLETGIDETRLTDEQYSLQHVKAFGVHNHLFKDPWHQDTVYWVDTKWQIQRLHVENERQLPAPDCVWKLENQAAAQNIGGRVSVTVHFPSPDWAVVADGAGILYLLNTGDRVNNPQWKVVHSEKLLGEGTCFTVVHSALHTEDHKLCLESVLLHIEENTGPDAIKTPFQTVLEWITLVSGNEQEWSVHRTRRLRGSSAPDYVAVEKDGKAIIVASERPFRLEFDSEKPVEQPQKPETSAAEAVPTQNGTPVQNGTEKPPPAYTWTQDEEDVTVQFTIPPDIGKTDIDFHLTPEHVTVGVKNGECFLKGQLYDKVDVEASNWTIADKRLDVQLCKAEGGTTWPLVVEGDNRGEQVFSPEQVARIHEQLAHLTSDTVNPDPSKGEQTVYNTQELEECDAFPDECSTMVRIDGDTHHITHKVNLGSNQWLFNTVLDSDKLPVLCLRHDVDGILWQPTNKTGDQENPWEHTATFNALGYVKASKQDNKFSNCPPDTSYAALSDCVRHVYIYHQPSPIHSPLRNRKTGREVSAVAKQQVVSLESVENIGGMVAFNERLFVLAGKTLYVVRVKQTESL